MPSVGDSRCSRIEGDRSGVNAHTPPIYLTLYVKGVSDQRERQVEGGRENDKVRCNDQRGGKGMGSLHPLAFTALYIS